jgi:hypothetical protein
MWEALSSILNAREKTPYMSVILGRWSQKDHKFEAILG